ncbi:MAG: putative mucin/carbohydrate-binding domain-containing protein, partial [Culicoidibacterales bacterium]
YLGEESFAYTNEQLDLSADKSDLIAAITAAQAISGADYTATSFANLQAAIIAAETLVTTPNVFATEITEAIQTLQAVVDELRVINVIEFKGYNNVVFLTLAVDQENQTFKAESNGHMVHPYQYSKVYVKVDHFDQQGNLKATYSVKADQTADEMASQLNAASIEQGDYIKLGHLEQNSRLAITGYIEGLESDLSQGVGTLDLQTAAFDLSGENLAYQIK